MNGSRCARCGTRLPAQARRCPTCGFAPDDGYLTALGGPDRPADGASQVRRRPDRRVWWSLGLLVGVLAALLGGEMVSLGERTTAAAPTTTPGSGQDVGTVTTSAPSFTTAATTSTSSVLAGALAGSPAIVAVPPGLSGRLYVLLAGGAVVAVDLTSGAVTKAADVSHVDAFVGSGENARMFVLDDGLVVWRDGKVVVAPWDPTLPSVTLPATLDPAAGGGRWAVFSERATPDGASTNYVAVDGTGRLEGRLAVDRSVRVAAVAGNRLVAQAADTIMLVDPISGGATPIGPGVVVAANTWGLVSQRCLQVTRCELQIGPWGEPGRIRLPGGIDEGALLSADGSHLASISRWPVVEVMELASGRSWAAGLGAFFDLDAGGRTVAGLGPRGMVRVARWADGPTTATLLSGEGVPFRMRPVALAFDTRPPG